MRLGGARREAAARLTSGLHQPAARSACPRPCGPDGPAACSPPPGSPCRPLLSEDWDSCLFPPPGLQGALPGGRGSPACFSRPAHLADGTCREP